MNTVRLVPGEKWRNKKTGVVKTVIKNVSTGKWGWLQDDGKFVYYGSEVLKSSLREHYEPYEKTTDSEPESEPEKPPIELIEGSVWKRKFLDRDTFVTVTLIQKDWDGDEWALLYDSHHYYEHDAETMKDLLARNYEQIEGFKQGTVKYELYNGARFKLAGQDDEITIYGKDDVWLAVADSCTCISGYNERHTRESMLETLAKHHAMPYFKETSDEADG